MLKILCTYMLSICLSILRTFIFTMYHLIIYLSLSNFLVSVREDTTLLTQGLQLIHDLINSSGIFFKQHRLSHHCSNLLLIPCCYDFYLSLGVVLDLFLCVNELMDVLFHTLNHPNYLSAGSHTLAEYEPRVLCLKLVDQFIQGTMQ